MRRFIVPVLMVLLVGGAWMNEGVAGIVDLFKEICDVIIVSLFFLAAFCIWFIMWLFFGKSHMKFRKTPRLEVRMQVFEFNSRPK